MAFPERSGPLGTVMTLEVSTLIQNAGVRAKPDLRQWEIISPEC